MNEKKKADKIKKINSNPMGRSLSLLNLTVQSGTRLAGLKLSSIFNNETTKRNKLQQFLNQQTKFIVDEIGKLKGSIMKAGQMLSIYGEHFFPDEVNAILKTLQSQSPPVVWSEIHKVLLRQLGPEKLAELEFEEEAFAAASIGQVYRARHKQSGTLLAVKVQYPGVDQAIDSDLKALKSIFQLSQLIPKGPSFEEIFREVRMMLHYESDYQRELKMIEQYREWVSDMPVYHVPKTYPRYCTKRVLCMEYATGLSVDSPEVNALSQERRNRLALSQMELMFKEIFQWRTVQTDPHFGNYKIIIDPNGNDRITLLDFGAVRKFPLRYIEPFAQLVYSAVEEDTEGIKDAGISLGFLRDEDSEEVVDIFVELCLEAVEGFRPEHASTSLTDLGPNPYQWGQNDLIGRLSRLAKDTAFAFKFRPPPREAVFLDRKMIGVFMFLSQLRFHFGPRDLIKSYVSPHEEHEYE